MQCIISYQFGKNWRKIRSTLYCEKLRKFWDILEKQWNKSHQLSLKKYNSKKSKPLSIKYLLYTQRTNIYRKFGLFSNLSIASSARFSIYLCRNCFFGCFCSNHFFWIIQTWWFLERLNLYSLVSSETYQAFEYVGPFNMCLTV